MPLLRLLAMTLTLLAAGPGCSRSDSRPTPAAPRGAAGAPTGHTAHEHAHPAGEHSHPAGEHSHPAGEHGHPAGEHAHGSPHGGVVASVPGGHVEARLAPDGQLTVWLLDANERTVPAVGATATARLAVPGAADVPLAYDPAQNALLGRLPAPADHHAVGIVTVTRPGAAPATARFSFHLEPGGH